MSLEVMVEMAPRKRFFLTRSYNDHHLSEVLIGTFESNDQAGFVYQPGRALEKCQ